MKYYLKKKPNLTKEQEVEADRIINMLGADGILAVDHNIEPDTGRSVICIKSKNYEIKGSTDLQQSPEDILRFASMHLSRWADAAPEGAFCSREGLDSVVYLFKIAQQS